MPGIVLNALLLNAFSFHKILRGITITCWHSKIRWCEPSSARIPSHMELK